MQKFTCNQWTEAGNPCGWIREKLEEAEEEELKEEDQQSQITWTSQDLSDTEPPTRQHTPADMKLKLESIIYSNTYTWKTRNSSIF